VLNASNVEAGWSEGWPPRIAQHGLHTLKGRKTSREADRIGLTDVPKPLAEGNDGRTTDSARTAADAGRARRKTQRKCADGLDGFTLKRCEIERPNQSEKRDTSQRPHRRPTTRGPKEPGPPKPIRRVTSIRRWQGKGSIGARVWRGEGSNAIRTQRGRR